MNVELVESCDVKKKRDAKFAGGQRLRPTAECLCFMTKAHSLGLVTGRFY